MKKEENEENKRLSQEVTQRFKEYPEILGISARAMSLTLGMSPDWLGGAKNGINCGALAGLLQKFPQVNAHYLLTGEGEPIIEEGKYMEAIVSGKVSAEMKKLRMILLVSCGKKPVDQPTEAPVAQTPVVYTVELCSDSGYPLEGIGVYVYTDTTKQELVWFARTDAEGKITFRDVTCEGYIAVLDGVSTDYIVEEHYLLTGEHTLITVEAQMQSGVDLSAVTRNLGDVMFDFTITDTDGKDYTLSELLKEKDAVVLNFWYINCGPCRQEFPYLQEAYEAYSDRIELLAMNPVDGTDERGSAPRRWLCPDDWQVRHR